MAEDTIAIDETTRLISSEMVDGTAVYGRDKERLGTVRNFMVDKLTGKAEYAVLQFGGFLGIGSDFYPIPWQMLDYNLELGGYIVSLTKDQLKNAPSYSVEPPVYDVEYGKRVHGHYGLAPSPFI